MSGVSRYWLLLVLAVGAAWADGLRDAVAALQRGDFPVAERTLRAELAAHPGEAAVLSLLGVALDGQNRTREAESFHKRAMAAAPQSIDVLGNYGNHLAASGDEAGARQAFLKIVGMDRSNANANRQLARMALRANRGAEAIEYLDRAPDALETLLAGADPSLSFSLGVALGNAGRYDRAEAAFSRVLTASPNDFNVLVNLGVAASVAGHNERARGILESALRQQPRNVDVLFRLAWVTFALKQPEASVEMLARAAKLAPERADVQKLLARVTADLGALDDSMAAWDRYLKLEPKDDAARRERAHTAVRMGNFDQAAGDLEQFIARHPDDPEGHFELGLAKEQSDPVQAMAHFDKALAIKPDFAGGRSARGSLNYQMGKPEAALADLEIAVKLNPGDPVALDRLGQTYSALDRPKDAVRVLRRAAELAPGDSKTQLHFGRALADAGETAESKAVMERFRQLGPAPKGGVPAGLVEYLGMTPEQRRADYRARLEKGIREKPDDAAARVAMLKVQLEEGKADEGEVRRIVALRPSTALLADAGHALLAARQYELAKEILEQAPVEPDLSIASFRALDLAGKYDEARSIIERAVKAGSPSAGLYWNAASVAVRNGHSADALRWLGTAKSDDARLLTAAVMAIDGKAEEARRILRELQSTRPEWGPVWTTGKLLSDPAAMKKLLLEKSPSEW